MPRALIGHTGFVGGNLTRQTAFDDLYRSTNIEDIAGKRYELLVCAGAPGTKWKANREPERDEASIERLLRCLDRVSADHVVLISSIDVYPHPIDVDEDTAIPADEGHAYGKHRLRLETFVGSRFRATIVRLPGLFGPGLKKNAIFDLLNDHELEKVCAESVFQFYPVVRLWEDVERARGAGLGLVNFATEPTGMRRVAEVLRVDPSRLGGSRAARYDMKTKYARHFGKSGAYLYDQDEVLAHLGDYAASEGWRGR